MKLSARLQACADLVQRGNVAADIGTDHGRLPIYLLKNHICPRVIAADLREKPLNSARQNAAHYGMGESISFCLSDGLQSIPRGDFRTVICAGMGGETICSILEAAKDIWTMDYQFILQPQSAPYELRSFLSRNGFFIRREILARDGKFVYTVMEVVWGQSMPLGAGGIYRPQGQVLRQGELYREYMERVLDSLSMTVAGLQNARDENPEKLYQFECALAELRDLEGRK